MKTAIEKFGSGVESERQKLVRALEEAEHALGHSPTLADGIEAMKKATAAKKNLTEFDSVNNSAPAKAKQAANQLGLNKPMTLKGNVSAAGLQLEKLLNAEERQALLDVEVEFRRYEEILTANSHTTISRQLSEQREQLMTATDKPLTQKELESWTNSAAETKRLAADRLAIAHARADKYAHDTVRPICLLIYRRLLPTVKKMLADAESQERKLHANWCIDEAVLPLSNTVREFVERLEAHADQIEAETSTHHSGPRDRLGLLINWDRISGKQNLGGTKRE